MIGQNSDHQPGCSYTIVVQKYVLVLWVVVIAGMTRDFTRTHHPWDENGKIAS